MQEIWKDIPWYEWKYLISNFGNVKIISFTNRIVKNKKIDRLRKQSTVAWWYKQVNLTKNWKNKIYLVHRLVALVFIPNPENKPQVNHINGVRNDNHVENLEWCTISENSLHSVYVLWYKRKKESIEKWLITKYKKVYQYSKDWELIKEWWCIKEASQTLWIDDWQISKCCNWKMGAKTAGGFVWKFTN